MYPTNWSGEPKEQEFPKVGQFIYPWTILGAGNDKISNYESSFDKSSDLFNWEINEGTKKIHIDFIEEWNSLQGHPIQKFIQSVSENKWHFLGTFTTGNRSSNKKTSIKLSFPNPHLYTFLNKSTTGLSCSKSITENYSANLIDVPFLKISPLNSTYLFQF
jgi:hypothetical protein